jgi:hypothetical protein
MDAPQSAFPIPGEGVEKENSMDAEILYPAIQMTNACNKNCPACLRSANTSADHMNYAVFKNYLADLRTLGPIYDIQHQFVTGGEPTIWKDRYDYKDIVDVLIALSEPGLIGHITMPSNGKVFEDVTSTRDFFTRLSKHIQHPIIVGISIANYQQNLTESGYIALDNVLRISQEPGMQVLPVILVTLSRQDDMDKRLHRIYPGVIQRITPLAPLGNAADMAQDCPSLSLDGTDKAPLGDFLPYFKNEAQAKLGISETEFDAIPNAVLMDKLSLHNHCGNSPFIDGTWHYCMPFKDDARFDLCPVGGMGPDTISAFLALAPVIGGIRSNGIITTVLKLRESLSTEKKDAFDDLFAPAKTVSVAYRGCMICKELHDRGVLGEMLAR